MNRQCGFLFSKLKKLYSYNCSVVQNFKIALKKTFGYGFITFLVISESLNVLSEVNTRMRQRRKRRYLQSRKLLKSCVLPSSEIQALLEQLQGMDKSFWRQNMGRLFLMKAASKVARLKEALATANTASCIPIRHCLVEGKERHPWGLQEEWIWWRVSTEVQFLCNKYLPQL